MNSLIVIPARMHSTRLPRKMLLSETGKPLIQHTYEAASRATLPSKVVVATDHEDIKLVVESFGGVAVMTDANHASGTDRVAEVARQFSEYELIVNVQGDEPEISPAAIDLAVRLLSDSSECVMATLATPIRDRNQLLDPACVKVVTDSRNQAMYFSRSAIPHPRIAGGEAAIPEELLNVSPPNFLQHVGLYVYRSRFLQQIASMPQAAIEKIESLEQLRVLHAGHSIVVGTVNENAAGIDTAEDYQRFVQRQKQKKSPA